MLDLILSIMFLCGEPSTPVLGDINHHRFCDSPNAPGRISNQASEIFGSNYSKTDTTIRYAKNGYEFVISLSDADSVLNLQLSCSHSDSILAFAAKIARSKILDDCLSSNLSRNDSVLMEKVIFKLAEIGKLCLIKYSESECRSYRIGMMESHSFLLCGEEYRPPQYQYIFDFNEARYEKAGKLITPKSQHVSRKGLLQYNEGVPGGIKVSQKPMIYLEKDMLEYVHDKPMTNESE